MEMEPVLIDTSLVKTDNVVGMKVAMSSGQIYYFKGPALDKLLERFKSQSLAVTISNEDSCTILRTKHISDIVLEYEKVGI